MQGQLAGRRGMFGGGIIEQRREHGGAFSVGDAPADDSAALIATPQGDFTLAAVIDITERNRGEEHFRSVVEAAPNAMLMIDRSGAIALVNAQAERLFGYPREELLGEPVEKLVPERFRIGHGGFRAGFHVAPSDGH